MGTESAGAKTWKHFLRYIRNCLKTEGIRSKSEGNFNLIVVNKLLITSDMLKMFKEKYGIKNVCILKWLSHLQDKKSTKTAQYKC
jgi:hypothetical protein